MSFNNIEIVRLRIEEARQNGVQDAYIRRIMAEEEGEQKVSWLRAILSRWIDKKAQPTATSRQRKSDQLTMSSHPHSG